MTNYEHYKEQIKRFTRMGQKVAINKDTNEIIPCADIGCVGCLFGAYDSCTKKSMAWADAEYIEQKVDWPKVAVDTPILVKQLRHNDWSRRYFSHYDNKNGLVCAFSDGKTSWTGQDDWKSWNYAKLAEVNDARIL